MKTRLLLPSNDNKPRNLPYLISVFFPQVILPEKIALYQNLLVAQPNLLPCLFFGCFGIIVFFLSPNTLVQKTKYKKMEVL
jgi:hypothetical protein